MALSAIGPTRELFRDSHITVLAPKFVAGLFKNHPAIDEVLSMSDGRHHGLKSVLETKKTLTGVDYQIGLALTTSLSSTLGLKLAGVSQIFGYNGNGRAALLQAPLAPASGPIHRSISYQNLISHAALSFWANPYWVKDVRFANPQIYLSEQERAASRALMEHSNLDLSRGFVALSPRAVAESRRWGVENYAALAQKIHSELNMGVALIGSSADRDDGERVRELAGGGPVNLCGRSRIRGTAATLSLASGFVGNDSGLAHLAALVDIPLVVLSGADNPQETSPLSDRKKVIIRSELLCISCVKNTCPQRGEGHMRCLREISVAEVLAALGESMQNQAPSSN